jgi:hypothetical protein
MKPPVVGEAKAPPVTLVNNNNTQNKWKNKPNVGGTPNPETTSNKHFLGACEAMKGSTYDYSDRSTIDQFTKTTKAIAIYVGSTYNNGGDICTAIEELSMDDILQPLDDLPPNPSSFEQAVYKEEIKRYVQRKDHLRANNMSLFKLIWGQCSDSMIQKLEANTKVAKLRKMKNGIGLLLELRGTLFTNQSGNMHPSHAMDDGKMLFYHLRQTRNMSTMTMVKSTRQLLIQFVTWVANLDKTLDWLRNISSGTI